MKTSTPNTSTGFHWTFRRKTITSNLKKYSQEITRQISQRSRSLLVPTRASIISTVQRSSFWMDSDWTLQTKSQLKMLLKTSQNRRSNFQKALLKNNKKSLKGYHSKPCAPRRKANCLKIAMTRQRTFLRTTSRPFSLSSWRTQTTSRDCSGRPIWARRTAAWLGSWSTSGQRREPRSIQSNAWRVCGWTRKTGRQWGLFHLSSSGRGHWATSSVPRSKKRCMSSSIAPNSSRPLQTHRPSPTSNDGGGRTWSD